MVQGAESGSEKSISQRGPQDEAIKVGRGTWPETQVCVTIVPPQTRGQFCERGHGEWSGLEATVIVVRYLEVEESHH